MLNQGAGEPVYERLWFRTLVFSTVMLAACTVGAYSLLRTTRGDTPPQDPPATIAPETPPGGHDEACCAGQEDDQPSCPSEPAPCCGE